MNIYEAKAELSQLIARAEAGETIVLARRGIPAAQLGPLPRGSRTVVFDDLAGRIHVSDDFDEWTEADEEMWFGK